MIKSTKNMNKLLYEINASFGRISLSRCQTDRNIVNCINCIVRGIRGIVIHLFSCFELHEIENDKIN